MKRERPDLDQVVEVCEHIVEAGKRPLWGRRNVPDGVADSGWQFRCTGDKVESPARFEQWSVGDLVAVDPSILLIINCPNGARVERAGPDEDWNVSGFDPRKPTR